MSQLGLLLETLKECGAERVVYAPNELAYAHEGDVRRPLAGSPIKGAIILEAVSELLSQDDITGLSTTRPRIVRHEHEGEEFVLEIVRAGSGISLGVRRQAARPARGAAPPPKPVTPEPPAQTAPKGEPSARRPTTGSIKRTSRKMRAADIERDLGARAPQINAKIEVQQDRIDTKPAVTAQPAAAPSHEVMQLARDAAREVARDVAREVAREAAREAASEAAREVAHHAAREVAREVAREIATETARETAREVMGSMLSEAKRADSPSEARIREDSTPRGGVTTEAGGSFAANNERPRAAPFAPPAARRAGPAKIDTMLREMLQKKASDLHLTADAQPVFRIDGEIHFASEQHAMSSSDVFSMVQEIMPERARNDFESLHDADFAYEIPGLARFRVNVFQDRHGTGSVLRQIPIEIQTAEKLGLPKACFDMCWLSKGLVLVTGPTGSGKSTTLAAMVDFINRNRSDHIITIEDPVEFVHHNQKCLVNQREVGQHTSSFKHALRAALREDPDIVMVGEMRDLETISIAIETAETGHLVFGTLHTTTAISTIDRIIDQFPTDRQEQIRVMLSESLKGVVAQVLLPKIGGGRVAAHEILIGTTAVASMIREGKTFQLASTMQTSKQLGMVTMNDALMNLVLKKLVDPKQAYMKAVDKNGFVTMLRSAGIQPPV